MTKTVEEICKKGFVIRPEGRLNSVYGKFAGDFPRSKKKLRRMHRRMRIDGKSATERLSFKQWAVAYFGEKVREVLRR